jgi:hypothetical protein
LIGIERKNERKREKEGGFGETKIKCTGFLSASVVDKVTSFLKQFRILAETSAGMAFLQ